MKRILVFIVFLFFLNSIVFAQYKISVSNKNVSVSFEEYNRALRNPMKGFREYFNPGVDIKRNEYPYPYGTMIKEYMPWDRVENSITDGVDKIIEYSNYRWEGVEDINMKVIPRVFIVWLEPWHGGQPQDPYNPDDLNGTHWADDMLPEYDSPYKQIPGSVGAMVEPGDSIKPIRGGYFDPSFPERVMNLIEKMGKAWDNDPRVAYVEMGIIGEWGEHHDPDISTYWPPHDEPKHVANRTWIPGIEKILGDAFSKAFKNKKVMVRYAYEFEDYEFGIYWDSWAIEQEIDRGYNEMLKLEDRWKTQPIGGEVTWNWGNLQSQGFRSFEDCANDEATRQVIIEQIRNLHCNHLGGITWANFNDPEFIPNADLIQKSLGYRFVLSEFDYPRQIKKGTPFNIQFKLTNKGSSPFYYDWPVEISLLDASTHKKVWSKMLDSVKISQWMPGENWSIEKEKYLIEPPVYTINESLLIDQPITPGKYIIAISVLDPAGMLPSIRFANTNYFNGGIHPIGYLGLDSKIDNFEIDTTIFDDPKHDKTLKYKIPN
ncbi:DUF4832 domain-containing protein [Mariniphaga sediminis]|uniref:DUF4832 domain-containing protein n=1 Tax=Mariniphaga sediminis TaxID=1628158 RepID=UPI003565C3AB